MRSGLLVLGCGLRPAVLHDKELERRVRALLVALDFQQACGPTSEVGVEIALEVGRDASESLAIDDGLLTEISPDVLAEEGVRQIARAYVQAQASRRRDPAVVLAPEAWRSTTLGRIFLDAWKDVGWTVLPLEPSLRRGAQALLHQASSQAGQPSAWSDYRIVAATPGGWLRIVEPHRSLVAPASAALGRAWSLKDEVFDAVRSQGVAIDSEPWRIHIWRQLATRLEKRPGATQLELSGVDLALNDAEAELQMRLLPEIQQASWWQRLSTPNQLVERSGAPVTEIEWHSGTNFLVRGVASPLEELRAYLHQHDDGWRELRIDQLDIDQLREEHGDWLQERAPLREVYSSLKRKLAAARRVETKPLPPPPPPEPPPELPPEPPPQLPPESHPEVSNAAEPIETARAVKPEPIEPPMEHDEALDQEQNLDQEQALDPEREVAPETQGSAAREEAPEPVTSEPIDSEPVASEPVASEPADREPIASDPVDSEPAPHTTARREPRAATPPPSPPSHRAATNAEPTFFDPIDDFQADLLILDEPTPPERLRLVINDVEVGGELRRLDVQGYRYRIVSPVPRHGDLVRVDIEAPLEGGS